MRKALFLPAVFLFMSAAAQASGELHWDAVLEVPAIETSTPGIFKVCPPGTRIVPAIEGAACVAKSQGRGATEPRDVSLQAALEWHLGALPGHIAVARGPLPAQAPHSILIAYKRYPKSPFSRKDI